MLVTWIPTEYMIKQWFTCSGVFLT